MKKIICILTVALLTLCMIMPAFAAETAKTQGGYKHVFIIGIDGAFSGRFSLTGRLISMPFTAEAPERI